MVDLKILWSKRLIRWSFYIVFLFLLALLFDKVIMPWYVRFGDEVELSDVVELPFAEARQKLEKDGFQVVVTDSVYDAHYPAGIIVEQMPLPFTTVKKGRRVYLKISIGEKPIIMPNLFYKSPRDAELILKSYGLKMGTKLYEYSDISLAGVVISQSYPAGQEIKKAVPINLTISLGPFPKRPTIPYLVKKSLDAAKRQLRLLGVEKIKLKYEERNDVLPETVLKQSLDPGILIDKNTEIELLVSKLKTNGEKE